jgi:hypothetical protein
MIKSNTTDLKFWAGGARAFHNRNPQVNIRTGFLGFLDRLFSIFKSEEIDQRLFLKKAKSKNGKKSER